MAESSKMTRPCKTKTKGAYSPSVARPDQDTAMLAQTGMYSVLRIHVLKTRLRSVRLTHSVTSNHDCF